MSEYTNKYMFICLLRFLVDSVPRTCKLAINLNIYSLLLILAYNKLFYEKYTNHMKLLLLVTMRTYLQISMNFLRLFRRGL